jgi:hypothetical protein
MAQVRYRVLSMFYPDETPGAEEEEQTPAESSPPSTPVKEKKSKSKSADLPEVDDTDWSADTSEQAVRERAEKLAGSVAAVAATDDLDKSTTERLELFFEFVKVGARTYFYRHLCCASIQYTDVLGIAFNACAEPHVIAAQAGCQRDRLRG